MLLLFSVEAHAEEVGRFTILSENQAAPFEGVLFDPIATADILTAKSFTTAECDLRLKHEVEKKETEFKLEKENLIIRHEALIQEYSLVIQNKDLEITQLQESLLKQSPRNNWWWAAGGAVAGIAITYGAYRAFDEQR
tara:strand:+ start:3616 stop:4029 length:414 start_codon:yes stop_codon:yes gene_type:complete